MKRIIDSTLVILSLMLIFGCKESKVGQGNPTKDSMSIDTDSVISDKVFTKQDIASEDTLNAVIRTQSPKSKDFDFEVFIMRGEKTVQIIPFSYPKDDTFDPNGGRKDSCLMADVTFDGNKDLLVYIWDNSEIKVWNIGMLMSGMKSSRSSCLFHHSMIFPILRLTKKKRLLNLSVVVLPLIMSLANGSSRKECLYKKNFCHTPPRESK